jgi:uncharacterized protein YbaR (Trm112 family)
MHVLLTDILICPRCGPAFPLTLLADRASDRRVEAGRLGCSNCREQYPVRDHTAFFADAAQAPRAEMVPPDTERLAALIGIAHGPALLFVAGAADATGLAALLDGVEVVAAGSGRAGPAGAAGSGVSRIVVGANLPLSSSRFAGAALIGSEAAALIEETARVLTPGSRLVVQPVAADVAARLQQAGLRIAAQDATTAVAVR